MLPEINVYAVNSKEILLNWFVVDDYATFNLYGCATFGGSYTLIEENIPNVSHAITPQAVLTKVLRSTLGIESDAPYYFKITGVDVAGNESDINDSLATSVDALDTINNNRMTDDNAPVYKSIIFSVTGTDQLVDVTRQLGRHANYCKIVLSGGSATVKFNSKENDAVPLPVELPQHALVIDKMYFSGSASVQIFVTGN